MLAHDALVRIRRSERRKELTAFEGLDEGSPARLGTADRGGVCGDVAAAEESRQNHGSRLQTWRTMTGEPGRTPPRSCARSRANLLRIAPGLGIARPGCLAHTRLSCRVERGVTLNATTASDLCNDLLLFSQRFPAGLECRCFRPVLIVGPRYPQVVALATLEGERNQHGPASASDPRDRGRRRLRGVARMDRHPLPGACLVQNSVSTSPTRWLPEVSLVHTGEPARPCGLDQARRR